MTTRINKYSYIQDPGHGWIQVPIAEIREFGLTPSSYSYMDGPWVYLEEDCDAAAWIKAREAAGCPVTRDMLRDVHVNDYSAIRDMARYEPSLAAQTMARLSKAVGA